MNRIILLICLYLGFCAACLSQHYSTGFVSPTATKKPEQWYLPGNVFKLDSTYSWVSYYAGCSCPYFALSSDSGITYTDPRILMLWDSTTREYIPGGPNDTWGRTWTEGDFANQRFTLKILDPTESRGQGYGDFNFAIPDSSVITGIQVKTVGYSRQWLLVIDLIQVNVFYYVIPGIDSHEPNGKWVSMYPNPATDKTTIIFHKKIPPGKVFVDLFSLQGLNVLHQPVHEEKFDIDLKVLPTGIYTLVISGSEGRSILKLVKTPSD
jgi:hypothetical protein